MRKTFFLTGSIFLCPFMAPAQKKVVVMGSSTAAGTGASHTDSSWVGRLQNHYRRNTNDAQDTVVQNLAWYGQTSYHQMPTGWISPVANRPAVDVEHNVTKAISLTPDVVIISLPSNDVANFYWEGSQPLYTTRETMDNFRMMKQALSSQGIKTWFTTTQPRNDMDFSKRLMQVQLLDSIRKTFGSLSLNFWDPLVTTDGQYLMRPELQSDAVHTNNTGHRLLFNQVISADIFSPGRFPDLPARMEAEDYVGMYGVQSEMTSDAGGGKNLGYIDPSDWMEYNVKVPSAQSFTLKLRVASTYSDAQVQVRDVAGKVLSVINLPNTGGWQNWQTVSSTISLPAGYQSLKLVSAGAGYWNINWLEFSPMTMALFSVSYPSIPGKIEAENYASMNGVQLETTSDVNGGKNVGYIDPGDWMDYTVSASAAGSYNLKLRVATPQANAKLEVRSSTGTLLCSVALPNTGDWQTWQTVSANLSLPAGVQTLKVLSTGAGYWNINWLDFSTASTGYVSIPARIEAEQWSAMSGVQKEITADAGGGDNVGYIDNGDWIEYHINVPSSKTYTINFRLATTNSYAKFDLYRGTSLLSTVNVVNTGGYQSWNTQSISVPLSAGPQTIRLLSTGGGAWNINWLQFLESTVAPASQPEEALHEMAIPKHTGIELFPNPVETSFTLTLNDSYRGPVLVKVVDMKGNTVQEERLYKASIFQSWNLGLKSATAGELVIVVQMGGRVLSRKIMKN